MRVDLSPTLTRWVRYLSLAAVFGVGFVVAYLSTILLAAYSPLPANWWLGGEDGLLLRPEPVIIPTALPFGMPAVAGTTVGVLLHNLLFRLTPGGITMAFSVVQTAVVAAGSYLGLVFRRRLSRPYNNLAATWVLSAFLILILGPFAAFEYQTQALEEMDHIFREVLLPINVLGLLVLEAIDYVRGRNRGHSRGN